jgi:hypothetical protein
VVESAKAAAADPEVKPLKLTAGTVQKFVDEALGIDRAAQARETRRQNEAEYKQRLEEIERLRQEERQPKLESFLFQKQEEIEALAKMLASAR